jgi:tRNA U34 5-carboxymethylaminomethyl modifying GTPase MnmE/TrmE
MTAAEMVKVYVANNEARRQQALFDSVYTPELKKAIANISKSVVSDFKISEQWKKQLAETVASQVKVDFPKYQIAPSFLQHIQEQFWQQNETIARIIKIHVPLLATGINFQLPEGWSETVAAWREQLEAEGDLGEEESAADRLHRLADERQHIVTNIARCSAIFEASRLLGIPIPPLLCALVLIAYVLADVANEILDERGDLD